MSRLVLEQSADARVQATSVRTWGPILEHGLAWWLRAPGAAAAWFDDGARGLPLTVGIAGAGGPWTTSAGTMFGAMTVDEAMRQPSHSMRVAARVVGPMLSMLARGLDPVVNLGTFATSTYLHEHDDPGLMRAAAEAARVAWPRHTLLVRSLDAVRTPTLLSALRADGWLLVPARQVWYYRADDARLAHRRELHHDQRLLDRTPLARRALLPSDAEAIVALYRQLYLGKYSAWNPDLHADAVREMLARGGLSGDGFARDGQLIAVAAYFDAPGVMTTPILGYELSLPKTLGLYRLLSMVILRRAQERGLLLHASAGADEFKRLRGAEAALEYVAVDPRGASRGAALRWRVVADRAVALAPTVFPFADLRG